MRKCYSLSEIRGMEAQGYCVARQPIVTGDVASRPSVAGYELLARLVIPGSPPRTPDQFFPDLNPKSRTTLDALVLRTAIQDVIESSGQATFINFNCSVTNLLNVDFTDYAVGRIRAIPRDDRHRLVLEITETENVDDKRLAQAWAHLRSNVDRLSALGIRIAIDDFGCGNACLRLMRNLPIAIIKYSKHVLDDCIAADRSEKTRHDSMSLDVMRSIGHTMRGWGCDVIVEGIESFDQLPAAIDLGANFYQGFLFGAPALGCHLLEGNDFRLAVGQ